MNPEPLHPPDAARDFRRPDLAAVRGVADGLSARAARVRERGRLSSLAAAIEPPRDASPNARDLRIEDPHPPRRLGCGGEARTPAQKAIKKDPDAAIPSFPARRQSAASSAGDDASLPFQERWQAIDVRRHLRPFAETHFLGDLIKRDRADDDCIRLADLSSGRGPECGGRRSASMPRHGYRARASSGRPCHAGSSSSSIGEKKSGPSPSAPGSRTPNPNWPWGMGTRRTTGLSPLAITTSSPDSAASISRESWVLAT